MEMVTWECFNPARQCLHRLPACAAVSWSPLDHTVGGSHHQYGMRFTYTLHWQRPPSSPSRRGTWSSCALMILLRQEVLGKETILRTGCLGDRKALWLKYHLCFQLVEVQSLVKYPLCNPAWLSNFPEHSNDWTWRWSFPHCQLFFFF